MGSFGVEIQTRLAIGEKLRLQISRSERVEVRAERINHRVVADNGEQSGEVFDLLVDRPIPNGVERPSDEKVSTFLVRAHGMRPNSLRRLRTLRQRFSMTASRIARVLQGTSKATCVIVFPAKTLFALNRFHVCCLVISTVPKLELPIQILEVPNIVKDFSEKFMEAADLEGTETKQVNQREIIEAALKRLNLEPKKAGFEVLGGKVGLRTNSIYQAWLGHQPIGAAALRLVQMIADGPSVLFSTSTDVLRDRPILSYIPRISWAHAGSLASFEELPADWQDTVPNTSSDPAAFALTIKGECMSPDYARPGDDVIVTPNLPITNGCLVVAKLNDGSILFRRYIVLKPKSSFRLDCANKEAGEDLKLAWKDVVWVYRVHASMRTFS